MPRLKTRTVPSLSGECLQAMESVQMNGKIPEIYRQFANSEPAVIAYLGMENSLLQFSLSELEIESIKVMVSQRAGCEYCLSVHTMKLRKLGMDESYQTAVRSNTPTSNARIDAILAIAVSYTHLTLPTTPYV